MRRKMESARFRVYEAADFSRRDDLADSAFTLVWVFFHKSDSHISKLRSQAFGCQKPIMTAMSQNKQALCRRSSRKEVNINTSYPEYLKLYILAIHKLLTKRINISFRTMHLH